MKTLPRNIIVLFFLSSLIFDSQIFAQSDGKKPAKAPAPKLTEQPYKMSIGLRGGFEGGITFKYFMKTDGALELIGSRGWSYGGFRFTGLYEIHRPFVNVAGLMWFFGFGAHVGFYDGHYYGYYGYLGNGYYDKNGNWHATGYRSNYTTIGIDAIIGLEYKIEGIPFTIGLDIKPFVDIYGYGGHWGDGAFSIRYVIK